MADMSYDEFRAHQDHDRAMDAVSGVEAENERLRARLAEVEAERDAYKYDYVMTSMENGQLQETMFAAIEQRDTAEARLVEVAEAIGTFVDDCGRERHGHCTRLEEVAEIIAAVRGEGDRPAEATPTDGRHPFMPPLPTWGIAAGMYPCGYYYGDSCDPLTVVYCRRAESDPIHDGEGDRPAEVCPICGSDDYSDVRWFTGENGERKPCWSRFHDGEGDRG